MASVMNHVDENFVGRVLRANTQGFACGTHSKYIGSQHDFGVFVKAPMSNATNAQIIGLIYAIEIQDDQLVNELVMAEYVDISILQDQRDNRMVPVEIKVLNIGYQYIEDGRLISVHSLPLRPPMSLSDVECCNAEEVEAFIQQNDYFRIVLNAFEVPQDDLLTAAIRYSAQIFQPNQQQYEQYLVSCGKHLAQDLSNDLKRLSHVLNLIHP